MSLYCWYQGCWPQQWLKQTERSWLYILRDVNDAAIVYNESTHTTGNKEDEIKKLGQVSEGTGKTVSEIIKDITGFYVIPKDKQV